MEKQYSATVVMKIIHFMAQAGQSLFDSKEQAEAAFIELPEDFKGPIMASLLVARQIKKKQMMSKLGQIFGGLDLK